MKSAVATATEITHHYTTTFEALSEIAAAYLALGRVHDAQHLVRTALDLTSVGDVETQDHLKLLLLSARILLVDYFLARTSVDALFATIRQARQIAEDLQQQQGIASALSLLGQAHYFVAVLDGALVDTPQSGKYDEALACLQQSLQLMMALQDTAGTCEDHFFIANVYDRWQQYEQAQQQYQQARQVAEQHGHLLIQAELARHRAVPAFFQDDFELALAEALQALSLREATPFTPYLPLDHLLLRDIYQAQGDKRNAQMHTEAAAALATEMGYPDYMASSVDLGAVKAARANMFSRS